MIGLANSRVEDIEQTAQVDLAARVVGDVASIVGPWNQRCVGAQLVKVEASAQSWICLLYTSDAADEGVEV